ncbi:hypothetical protein [Reyranella sp.]|jgi:hypothetical protein|uniref:hypothetical protein n=1 Tax=Reyranella sp. TaxID=1929291 RepID=UPI000BCC1775|nr:hypothetical protein [Reyranella sp.]OYY45837.1 MAG: hypothetical protein B7Y57_02960 [Rhodospirillales bacterium 35-66-84]OYZ96218.1 MAG: hypothetical protein B7Y08_03320 [Rhodospirillales bacterium 24-66-33]OZB28620.1 MAG: hypothetical protein B7X63_01820 [Rhodospirillales bacterium 39-66-50]HQS14155.1 hypothetical protein [Reyranella sp.]HQT11151.1 hypothetical protein [Reyranella sp.]
MFLSGAAAFVLAAPMAPLHAQTANRLDPGGLTFRDFGVPDNGASYTRGEQSIGGGTTQKFTRVLGIDPASQAVRLRFDSVKVELLLPMGWQASEDGERGVAYTIDKRIRLIVWRVDFAYEGVRDAEHYAATKAGSMKARRPGVQAQARKLPDGRFLVVYENVPRGPSDSSGPRTVFDLVIPDPRNTKVGVLVTLGVPTSEAGRGLHLLALITQNMRIDW